MQGRSARQLHATSYTLQATSYKLLTTHYLLQVDQRAIYKLIFLDRRAQALCGAGADGVLRFWNVKSYGECVWEQHAGHAPGEAVVALATDAANKLLFSGDSAGFVKVWGIANFVNVGGVEQSNNVKELHHWRAHDKAVASLDYIERKNLLLSASLDSQAYIRIYAPATLGLAHRSLQPCVVGACSPPVCTLASPCVYPASRASQVKLWRVSPEGGRLAGVLGQVQPNGWLDRPVGDFELVEQEPPPGERRRRRPSSNSPTKLGAEAAVGAGADAAGAGADAGAEAQPATAAAASKQEPGGLQAEAAAAAAVEGSPDRARRKTAFAQEIELLGAEGAGGKSTPGRSDSDESSSDGEGDGSDSQQDPAHHTQDMIRQILAKRSDPSQRKAPPLPTMHRLKIHDMTPVSSPRERFTPRESARGAGQGPGHI